MPLYNKECIPSCTIPDIYNAEGKKMEVFFLRDIHSAHDPHGDGSKYFIWDRYNYGLNTHFYTHRAMLETMGKPRRKYGMLIETPAIVPEDYKIFDKYKGIEKEFDAIFTYDEKLLNSLPNAEFFPGGAGVWYGKGKKDVYDDKAYEKKTKNISFLSSNKVMCEMHKKRVKVAKYCYENGLLDVYGKVVSNEYVDIELPFKEYRFSLVIENMQTDYYFTEKITNCFAAQTIPIYLGARKIGDFFNEDGIIVIKENDLNDIENIIKQCTVEEYERRRLAVIDNYQRVKKYMNMLDYLYEQYF